MALLQGIVAAFAFFAVAEAFNRTLIDRVCNVASYDTTTAYSDSVEMVLGNIIVLRTPQDNSHDYYVCPSTPPSGNVGELYVCGRGSCDKALTMTECSQCLEQAAVRMLELCRRSIGAQARLQDCRIRYEHYYFRH